jgi:hypothetical protein
LPQEGDGERLPICAVRGLSRRRKPGRHAGLLSGCQSGHFARHRAAGLACHHPAMSRYRRPKIEGGNSFSWLLIDPTGRQRAQNRIGRFRMRRGFGTRFSTRHGAHSESSWPGLSRRECSRSSVGCAKSPCEAYNLAQRRGDFAHAAGLSCHKTAMSRCRRSKIEAGIFFFTAAHYPRGRQRAQNRIGRFRSGEVLARDFAHPTEFTRIVMAALVRLVRVMTAESASAKTEKRSQIRAGM